MIGANLAAAASALPYTGSWVPAWQQTDGIEGRYTHIYICIILPKQALACRVLATLDRVR